MLDFFQLSTVRDKVELKAKRLRELVDNKVQSITMSDQTHNAGAKRKEAPRPSHAGSVSDEPL